MANKLNQKSKSGLSRKYSHKLEWQKINVRTKIRSIGNSRGIILSNKLLQKAGLAQDADIIVTAHNGQIIIVELKVQGVVNTDLSSWEKQFKQAIKKRNVSEKDLFEGIRNEFDQNEWTA